MSRRGQEQGGPTTFVKAVASLLALVVVRSVTGPPRAAGDDLPRFTLTARKADGTVGVTGAGTRRRSTPKARRG